MDVLQQDENIENIRALKSPTGKMLYRQFLTLYDYMISTTAK